MKPTLTEQLAYCDAWLEKNKPVVWPSMVTIRMPYVRIGADGVAGWTRGAGGWDQDGAWENDDIAAYRKVIRPGHWSVLEFSWYCYAVKGVSRICTHELVRHRQFSFAQESTRVVKPGYILPSEDDEENKRYITLGLAATSILVAGNGRAWAEMLRKRLCLRAAPEIRYLAWLVASDLKEVAPLVYAVSVPDCEHCEEEGCSL